MNNKKTVQTGFSLLELMITVAVLGIISSIAYPSYMKQVQKSKRTSAKVELMRIAQLQESYYVQNLSYAKALSGNAAAGGLGFASGDVFSEGGDYKMILEPLKANGDSDAACTGTSATSCIAYRISATPVSGKSQAHDGSCTGLRLTNTGAKSAKSTTHTSYGTASVRDECW